MITQIEINLTHLADTEQVVLKDAKVADIKSVIGGSLFGSWIGKESISAEVCKTQRDTKNLRVQLHIYNDRYCKGVQLLLTQSGNNICGKLEWGKVTGRRTDRNANTENIMQSDWNDLSNATNISNMKDAVVGKDGYGIEKIIVEMEQQEEIVKEVEKVQDVKPEATKGTETKTEKMKCPKCGAESTGKFCPECGTQLVKTSETTQQKQANMTISFPTESTVQSAKENNMMQSIVTNKKETYLLENTLHIQLERKINEVQQLPVHLEEHYAQVKMEEEELSHGLSFDNPKKLFNLGSDSYILRKELFAAIENAASGMDGYYSEAKAKKRAAGNFRQVAENPKIQKSKFLFAECVEERIIRIVNPMEQVVGQDCERLKNKPSCESPYDVPYDERSDGNRIFNYEIREDGAHQKCHVCNGEKIERCPKCDGSGREQYIDSYFASGETKYKTGRCSRCYGNGYITCRHCDGSGLEFKGQEIYANVRSYKEKRFYNFACFGISPWGYTDRKMFVKYINYDHPIFDHPKFHNTEFEQKHENNKIIVQ